MASAYQAHVDSCSSDESDGHAIGDTLPRKSSPQANVSTKRSKDLKSDKSDSGYSSYTAASKSSADSAPSTSRMPPSMPTATAQVHSQGPAPKPRKSAGGEQRQQSTDSSPRQKPPSRTPSVSKPRPTAGRRTTLTQEPRDGGAEESRDANWLTLGPHAALPLRPRPEMPSSSRDVHGYASDQLSQHSDPHPYSPPSPTYARQPPTYAQGPAYVQTARTRRPSSATRPRPQSYAGGEPGPGYWVPGMPAPYPSPPQEPRGPPPSFSAYRNMPNMPNMQHMQNMQHMPNMHYPSIPPYMPPMAQSFYPPQHQTSPPYDMPPQRPTLSARASSSHGPRNYAAPIITQGSTEPSKYSARYGQPPTPVEHQHQSQMRIGHSQPKLLHYGYEDEDNGDYEEESSHGEEDYPDYNGREGRRLREDRALMPPPNLRRNSSQRRPTLSHAKTAPDVDRLERRDSRRQSIVVKDPVPPRERERDPRSHNPPLRRTSASRPPHRQTQSEYDARYGRIEVNNSKSNRRLSYQAYEKAKVEYAKVEYAKAQQAIAAEERYKAQQAVAAEERYKAQQAVAAEERYKAQQAVAAEERYKAERRREKRASRVIVQQRHIPGQFDDYDDEESEEEEPAPLSRSRRKTDASESRKGKERIPESKNKRAEYAAEEYINATRGSRDPFADQINKAARKGSRMPSAQSDSNSSRSNGSGKVSQSKYTTMSNTNNEVRLRIDGGQAINLQLTGDMEGRTLQLVPAENGQTELVIGGNARGSEVAYRSEQGSFTGNNRRSIVAGQGRRDAEDVSERSSRSSRNRRERDESREIRDERGRHILQRSSKTTYH